MQFIFNLSHLNTFVSIDKGQLVESGWHFWRRFLKVNADSNWIDFFFIYFIVQCSKNGIKFWNCHKMRLQQKSSDKYQQTRFQNTVFHHCPVEVTVYFLENWEINKRPGDRMSSTFDCVIGSFHRSLQMRKKTVDSPLRWPKSNQKP